MRTIDAMAVSLAVIAALAIGQIGVVPVTSDDFARELKIALRERKSQKEMEKRVDSPSPLEIDLWDEVFKDKP